MILHKPGANAKKKKQKSNMSVGESFQFLAKSPYIRDLATLVSPLYSRRLLKHL